MQWHGVGEGAIAVKNKGGVGAIGSIEDEERFGGHGTDGGVSRANGKSAARSGNGDPGGGATGPVERSFTAVTNAVSRNKDGETSYISVRGNGSLDAK